MDNGEKIAIVGIFFFRNRPSRDFYGNIFKPTRVYVKPCMCVCVYTFDQVEENLLPPIEDHFSRSFDESFIRHVVTSVNYPPPFPRIESRASPQASKGFNTVPVILHKPVHLTLLLTAKNEAGEKDCLVTWPGVCLSYTRFQQIAAPPPSTNTSLDCCLSKRRTSRISARLTGRHYLRYR